MEILAVPKARLLRVGREASWIVIGQFVTAIASVVGVRMLTGAVPASVYGQIGLALTASTLAQQLLFNPLLSGAMRFYGPAVESGRVRSYLGSLGLLSGGACAIVLTAALAGVVVLKVGGRPDLLALLATAIAFSLIAGVNSVMDGIQNAARQRGVVAFHAAAGQWSRYLIAVAFAAWLGARSSIVMAAFTLAAAVVLGSQTRFLFRLVSNQLSRPPALLQDARAFDRDLLRYGLPFCAWGLFTWAQLASDKWALQTYCGARDVGLYQALYQIGYYPISLLSGFLSTLITPILFSRAGDGGDSERVNKSHRLNGILALVCAAGAACLAAGGALFHRRIFAVLVAPEYRAVSSLLPVLILSSGLSFVGQNISVSLMIDRATGKMVVPKIVTACFGAAANFAAAHIWGLRGVAWAGLATASLGCAWMLIVSGKYRPFDTGRHSMRDLQQ